MKAPAVALLAVLLGACDSTPVAHRETSELCLKGFDVIALPEMDRKAIHRFVTQMEDRAQADGEKSVAVPTWPAPREQRVAAGMRQAKTAIELTKEYRGAAEQRMAEEYRRPVEEVAKVWYEGVCRDWVKDVPELPRR